MSHGSLNDLMTSHPYGYSAPLHQGSHAPYLTGSGYCNGVAPTPTDLSSFYSDPMQAAARGQTMAAGGSPWYATNTEARLASKISNSLFMKTRFSCVLKPRIGSRVGVYCDSIVL